MAEVAANLAALTEHALQNVAQPPRGSIKEVGHYRVLNERLKRKDLEALQSLLDEVAYNVAATLFATLDGAIESDLPTFPKLLVVDAGTQQPIAPSLHQAFEATWEAESEDG